MFGPRNIKIVLEVDLEELAYISLALDHFVNTDDSLSYGSDHSARRAQERWDKLYKDLHRIRGLGVKEIRL